MNIFVIYKNGTLLLNRMCDSPPSLEEKNIIVLIVTSKLKYSIDVIKGNKHVKLRGEFSSIDGFIQYLENLCKDGITYGVELDLY